MTETDDMATTVPMETPDATLAPTRALARAEPDPAAEMERLALEAARRGDIHAVEVWRRLREGRPGRLTVELPAALDTHEGIDSAQVTLIRAVAGGAADPRDAGSLSGMLDNLRRSMASRDLEQRLRALEAINAARAATKPRGLPR